MARNRRLSPYCALLVGGGGTEGGKWGWGGGRRRKGTENEELLFACSPSLTHSIVFRFKGSQMTQSGSDSCTMSIATPTLPSLTREQVTRSTKSTPSLVPGHGLGTRLVYSHLHVRSFSQALTTGSRIENWVVDCVVKNGEPN